MAEFADMFLGSMSYNDLNHSDRTRFLVKQRQVRPTSGQRMLQANASSFFQKTAGVLAVTKRTSPRRRHFTLVSDRAIDFFAKQNFRCSVKRCFGIADGFRSVREVMAHLRAFPRD